MYVRKGFTLIELLIGVAIVGVLLAIAVPSYSSYIQKQNRIDAIAHVLELAADLAKLKATTMSYRGGEGEENDSQDYSIRVSLDDKGGYIISASPVGSQRDDPCGDMTYYAGGLWEFSSGLDSGDCLG